MEEMRYGIIKPWYNPQFNYPALRIFMYLVLCNIYLKFWHKMSKIGYEIRVLFRMRLL